MDLWRFLKVWMLTEREERKFNGVDVTMLLLSIKTFMVLLQSAGGGREARPIQIILKCRIDHRGIYRDNKNNKAAN